MKVRVEYATVVLFAGRDMFRTCVNRRSGRATRRLRYCRRRSISRPRQCARALWVVLGAVLPIALSTYLLPARAEAAGPVETITVTLSPSSIVADGVSTSAATATLSFGGVPLPGQTVAFSSSDRGIQFGPAIDNLDGTYTATLTGSTAVGTPTITATSQWAGQTASGEATLTQTPGPAKNMILSLTPRSIIADGSSFTIATATVADAHGNPVPMDNVVFSSSDPGERVVEGEQRERHLQRGDQELDDSRSGCDHSNRHRRQLKRSFRAKSDRQRQHDVARNDAVDLSLHARSHQGPFPRREWGTRRRQGAHRLQRPRMPIRQARARDFWD